MNHSSRIASVAAMVAVTVAVSTTGVVIIQSQSTSQDVLIKAFIAGLVAGGLAFVASIWLKSIGGALMPLTVFLTIGIALQSHLSQGLLAFTSLCGTVLGIYLRRHLTGARSVVGAVLSAILLIFVQKLGPALSIGVLAEACFVLLLSSAMAALLSNLSSYIEVIIGRTIKAMRSIFRPALAFIAAYSAVAFLFAISYGVMYYFDNTSIVHESKGHLSPDLLCLFQWSLTVFVAAGSSEFQPSALLARVVFMLQVLVNIFITSFFLAYFLVREKDSSRKETR